MDTIQLIIFEIENEPIHWIAFSAKKKWAYISKLEDDFTRFLEVNVKHIEKHEVIDGHQDSNMFYLEDDLFFHYSSQRSLLLEWRNKKNPEKRIKNKLWIENFNYTSQLKGTVNGTIDKDEVDDKLKNSESGEQLIFGGFHKQEELPETNPLGIIVMILGGLLGLWWGCQEDQLLDIILPLTIF